MDWNKIERGIRQQTSSILQSRSQDVAMLNYVPDMYENNGNSISSRNNNNNRSALRSEFRSEALLHLESSTYCSKRDVEDMLDKNNYNIDVNISNLCKELSEMRNHIDRQNEKIKYLEKKDIESAMVSNYERLCTQINHLEMENSNMTKHITNLSRENSDMHIFVKSLMSKIHLLEEAVRSSSQEYVTKIAYSQLLDSCLEQIKGINSVAESSRVNSMQAQHTVELLLYALSEMNGNNSSSNDISSYRLEHLSSISG
jgi:hypothetical protein